MSQTAPTTTFLSPADNAGAIAHINLIQGIINRLANNSASCKTWCLTLVGALVSLAGATRVAGIITFALLAVLIFAFLDSMYLAQERSYRELYARISAKIRDRSYGLQDAFEARAPLKKTSAFAAFFSWSIWPVYGGLIAAYVLAYMKGWLALLASAPK